VKPPVYSDNPAVEGCVRAYNKWRSQIPDHGVDVDALLIRAFTAGVTHGLVYAAGMHAQPEVSD